MNGRRLNMWAYFLSISAITYWHIKKCKELPWPPQYIYTGLVFIMLDVFSLFQEELSGLTSIGFVIAIFLKEGWIAECEHGGTGQPQTTAFLSDANYKQPPSTGSMADYQNQLGTGPGGVGSSGTTGAQFV